MSLFFVLSSTLHAQYSTIEWARLIGGSMDEYSTKVVTEGGYTYIGGNVLSKTLPVIGGRAANPAPSRDIYFAKFNSAGVMVFSTYIGGTDEDVFYNYNSGEFNLFTVVGDDIYMAGKTESTDLPVTDGTTFDGVGTKGVNWDGFVAKINSVTGAIGFCSYFGNDGAEFSQDPLNIAVSQGDLYVSWDQFNNDDWYSNPVISKFDGTTGAKLFATNFGPVTAPWATDDYWNFMPEFQVVGNTIYTTIGIAASVASPFPLSTDGTVRDPNTDNIAYAKYNATTGALEFLTYIGGTAAVGGNSDDVAYQLKVYNGDTYIIGGTLSSDFPVTDGSSASGYNDIVILKYNSSNALVWAKRLGGNDYEVLSDEYAFDIVGGKLYLIGKTRSADFPTTNGTTKTSSNVYWETFITKMDTDGNILFSTFIGGNEGANPKDLVVGCNEEVYLFTQSVSANTGYPITNGVQPTVAGSMLSKFDTHTGELLYSGVLDYANGPTNIEYIGNGTVQLLANNQMAVSSAVTAAGDVFSTNGNFYTARINTCPTGYTGSTAVSPATQMVCVGGLVSQITMAPAMIPGSSLPPIYISGVQTQQPDIPADYQWQVSNDGVSGWADVPGATLQNYVPDPSTINKYYRRIVRTTCCGVTTIQHTGDVAAVTMSPNTAPIANAGGAFVTCPGTSVIIGNSTIATGGALPYTVLWDNGLGTVSQPTVTPTQSTIYTLKVTDGNGCADLDQAIVTTHRAYAGPDMGNCAGTGTRIGGDPIAGLPGVVYSWTASPAGPSMSCTNCAQPTVNPTTTTIYTLTLTIPITSGGTCTTTDDVVVRPVSGPTTPNFAGTDRVICIGSTASLGTTPTAADATTYTPTAVSQSSVNTYTGTIANLSDGNFTTGARTTTISSWVMLDLGIVKTISEVQLAAITNVNNLNSRKLQVSTDNITWTDVLTIDGVSNTALTSFQFYPVNARYVRVSLGYSGVVETSEFIVKESFYYTWAPGNYITDNHIPVTTFQPGNLAMPDPNSGLYYLTAIKGGCSFVDQVETAVIEARAGVDGCGPRLLGKPDRTPGLNETYTWVKLSGPGNFVGPTNVAQPAVSASVGGTTVYELTVSYTLNGVSQTCTDQVSVPDCGCVVDIAVEAPFSCPSYSLNGGVGTVKLIASAADIFSNDPSIFTYTWTPAVGLTAYNTREVYLTDNVSRTYTVTMGSPFDPSFQCTRTIDVNGPAWSLPVFTAQDVSTCPSTPVSIGQPPVAGYAYSWTTSGLGTLNSYTSSNPTATTASSTDFYVLITDIGSTCTTKDTATITLAGLPSNPAGSGFAICGSATGVQLGAAAMSGVTYSWYSTPAGAVFSPSNTVANPTVSVATTTTFSVLATNTATGCSMTDNMVVQVNSPVAPFSFTNTTFCPGTAGAIPLPAGPSGMTNYAWTSTTTPVVNPTQNGPTATTSNPRPQVATTYTLSVTNSVGCIGSASVVMTPTVTTPDAGVNKTFCLSEGSTTLGSASNPTGAGITYAWTPTTGLNDATSPNPTFTPSAAGITTYTLTKTDGACTSSDQVVVTVMDFTLPTMSSPTICQNACVEIGTTPLIGATYLWTPSTGLSDVNISNPMACPTSTTTYTLHGTGANGCEASQTVGVTVNGSPAPTVTISPASACLGDDNVFFNPTVSPAGSYNYQWSPNNGTLSNIYASNPEVYVMGVGTTSYDLTVTNATTGCMGTAVATLTVTSCPPPTGSVGNYVWNDTNGNGLQDEAASAGINGVVVELWNGSTNTLVASTTTANDGSGNAGYYNFVVTTSGDYYVKFPTTNGGSTLSPQTTTAGTDGNSDASASTGQSPTFAIDINGAGVAKDNMTIDAGYSSLLPSISTIVNASGCYDDNGNTAGGNSKAVVQVIVSWVNAPAGEGLDVTVTGAPMQSINASAEISPKTLYFEVNAASAGTVDASFSISGYPATQHTYNTGAVSACLLTPCVAGNTGGQVFRDFDNDGIKDTYETEGVPNVVVTAFWDNAGTTGTATTVTDYKGQYTFVTGTGANQIPSGAKVRIEFSSLPAGASLTSSGTNNGTAVQFITAPMCGVDLGVNYTNDYCQTNPTLILPKMQGGDPLLAGNAATEETLIGFPYNSDISSPSPSLSYAQGSQTGSIWGTAYHRKANKLFSSAIARRHIGYGPLGTGGIYVTDLSSNTTSSFVNLGTLGVSTGANTHEPLPADYGDPSRDSVLFHDAGKLSLGGMDISDDDNYLFVMNLKDKELVRIEVGGNATVPTSANITKYPLSAFSCTNGNLRPWAVKYYRGKVYLGLVCDGATGARADMLAKVVALDLSTSTFSTVIEFPLLYIKGTAGGGGGTQWNTWTENPNNVFTSTGNRAIYPQPILSSITFDGDGTLVMGFLDRLGLQTGKDNYNTNGAGVFEGMSGGDILRAYHLNGLYELETNAKEGFSSPKPATNGEFNIQGPDLGEFYWDDRMYLDGTGNGGGMHAEVSLGSVEMQLGTNEVVSVVYDPRHLSDGGFYTTSGMHWYSNTTGQRTHSYEAASIMDPATSFGKSGGLGDVELICNQQPIEIGNYVWVDADADGIQDPTESGIPNVQVQLFNSLGVLVGVTTTNTKGEYYFNTSNVDTTGVNPTGTTPSTGWSGLAFNRPYYIVIGNGGANPFNMGALFVSGSGYGLTLPNTGQGSIPDQNDNDATIASGINPAFNGFPYIAITTEGAGSTNHTYDFGFKPVGTVGNYVWTDTNGNGLQDEAATSGMNGIVVELWNATTNTLVTSTTTANDGSGNAGYYNFVITTSGDYYVKFPTTSGGYILTTATTTSGTDGNSDANVSTGQSPTFTINVNGTGVAKDNMTIDAGFTCPGGCVPISVIKH